MKRLSEKLFFIFTLFSTLILLISCAGLINPQGKSNSSLSLTLPFMESNARAAEEISYNYTIEFLHESGSKSELSGKSGETIRLSPAKAGRYTITGSAYNSDKILCYKGSCEVSVEEGEKKDVSLELKKTDGSLISLEADSAHVYAKSDEKGTEVTINYIDGDCVWDEINIDFRNVNNPDWIRLYPQKIPEKDKPVVIYNPFTEAGEEYEVTCRFYKYNSDELSITETFLIGGAAEKSENFGYTSDYYKDASLDTESGLWKTESDFFGIFKEEAIKNNVFTSIDVKARMWGMDSYNDGEYYWKYWIADYVIPVMSYEDGKQNDSRSSVSSLIKNGFSWWEISKDNIVKAIPYPYIFASASCEFILAEYPDQKFITSLIYSPVSAFSKPEEYKNNDHISVEACSEGIKITVKILDGECGFNTDWTNVEELESGISIHINDFNGAPDLENPSYEYIFPFTEAGKLYTFRLNGDSERIGSGYQYLDEKVWCKAGGGIGKIYDYDMWNNTDVEINYDGSAEDDKYTFCIDGDLPNIVNEEQAARYENLNLFLQLWSGKVDFSGEVNFLGMTTIDMMASSSLLDLAEIMNPCSLDRIVMYGEEKISAYDIFFISAAFDFIISGYDLRYNIRPISTQEEYKGEKSPYSLISGNDSLGNNWEVYYSCFENEWSLKKSATNFKSVSESECEFTLDNDFDNDVYELQFKKRIFDFEEGQTYMISFNLTPSMDITKFEYDIFGASSDSDAFYHDIFIDGIQIAAGESITLRFQFSVDSLDNENNINLCLIPFKAGTYKISNLNIERL